MRSAAGWIEMRAGELASVAGEGEMKNRVIAGLLLVLTGAAPVAEPVPPFPPDGTYRYAVAHPSFGDIGSYSNSVTRTGNEVTVRTHVEIRVRIAFVTVRQIIADRSELWRNGKLTRYRSVTVRDGKTIEVNGEDQAAGFVIQGPLGKTVAPADVFPSNPWWIAMTRAKTVMAAETGRLRPVDFRLLGTESVQQGDRDVAARHFASGSGADRADLWYDGANVPVKFSIVEDDATITLTLGSAPGGSEAMRSR
jgi:Family of unknown function (DUF6134)